MRITKGQRAIPTPSGSPPARRRRVSRRKSAKPTSGPTRKVASRQSKRRKILANRFPLVFDVLQFFGLQTCVRCGNVISPKKKRGRQQKPDTERKLKLIERWSIAKAADILTDEHHQKQLEIYLGEGFAQSAAEHMARENARVFRVEELARLRSLRSFWHTGKKGTGMKRRKIPTPNSSKKMIA